MRWNKITATITLTLATLTSWLGILAVPVYLLFAFNVTDYITGITASKFRNVEISSYYGIRGIIKKVFMYILIGITVGLEILVKYAVEQTGIEWKLPYIGGAFVAIWLVLNEGISILENLNDMKVPMPPFLMPFVRRLKSQVEETVKVEDDTAEDELPVINLEEDENEDI